MRSGTLFINTTNRVFRSFDIMEIMHVLELNRDSALLQYTKYCLSPSYCSYTRKNSYIHTIISCSMHTLKVLLINYMFRNVASYSSCCPMVHCSLMPSVVHCSIKANPAYIVHWDPVVHPVYDNSTVTFWSW